MLESRNLAEAPLRERFYSPRRPKVLKTGPEFSKVFQSQYPKLPMQSLDRQLYEFDSFRLDPLKRTLWRDGEQVALPPKVFNTLLALIEQRDGVVSKDDLLARIWPDTVVEEANLTVYISALRKTLGEGKRERRYIVTVPGQGYQFVGEVRQVGAAEIEDERAEVALLVEQRASARLVIEDDEAATFEPPSVRATAVAPAHRLIARRARFGWKLPVAAVLVLLLGGAAYYRWFWMEQPRAEIKSIAVLPFSLLSDDQADEYLGVALADALIMRLSHLRQAAVRPTSAVLKYRRSGADYIDSLAAGRALEVDAVLEGNIRKAGDVVRVSVQLVRVADGRPLWADKFDERAADVLTIEDRVSTRVAAALAVNLTDEERTRLARRHTANFAAYQEYLRGRFQWNKRTPESLRAGIDHFRRAIELDANFALAWAGLADCYTLLGFRVYGTLPPHETMPQARNAALKALELDATLAEAHASLGLVKLRYDWDFAGAEAAFKRAATLNPGYAPAHQWYAELLWLKGRGDEAQAEYKLAAQADPSSLSLMALAAVHLYYRREYDRAAALCRKMIETEANAYLPHLILGLTLQQQGKYEEAATAIERALRAGAGRAGQSALGCVRVAMGQRDEALRLSEEFTREAAQTYVDPLYVAAIYSSLRDVERTLAWLEKGRQDRSTAMIYLGVDPRYDWLHTAPRFVDLLRSVGVEVANKL